VWDDKPLFNARIEAWAHGPVSPKLYNAHRGKFMVNVNTFRGLSDDRKLTKMQKETIDAVLDFYAERSPGALSALTHHEKPWRDAREGLRTGDRSHNVITIDAMVDYYSSL
jgi:uncharacterized phage-associated protein